LYVTRSAASQLRETATDTSHASVLLDIIPGKSADVTIAICTPRSTYLEETNARATPAAGHFINLYLLLKGTVGA
jgi:hypothetical protein